jgi:hypothetical protein
MEWIERKKGKKEKGKRKKEKGETNKWSSLSQSFLLLLASSSLTKIDR